MKHLLYILLFLITYIGYSQQRKIKIIHSDNTFTNEEKYPEAIVALGNVMVEHEGATLQCKQALIYQKTNIIKAFGDVVINQGDTIHQTSKFVSYNGNTKIAKSWGNVVLTDPKMTLTTDTLQFNRNKQIIYYQHNAVIKDSINTLKSKIGKYYLENNKFQALSNVEITNPDNTINSEELDYYTNTGISYLFGPTNIVDTKNKNTIYSEKGYHDSKNKISYFVKNAKINYQDRIIYGDSLYYDENRKFASATGNIKVLDTINNSVIKGGYSEYYQDKDSVYIVERAVAISLVEKDSMYIHGDTLLVTGKQDNRIIRAYHHVKFFKENLQGKCDSLYSDKTLGLTKMYRRPILWNEENQITGDSIHFLSNNNTQQLDSLKVYNNAFVIKKDSTGGFSQIKGKNLIAKFVDDKMDNIHVLGNGEMINYNRNEKKELIGITKLICSNMVFDFKNGQINSIRYDVKPSGKTYPPSKFPEQEKKLKGFIWRENEKPLTKDAIFIHDKGDDELIQKIIEKELKLKREKALAKKREEARNNAANQTRLERPKGKSDSEQNKKKDIDKETKMKNKVKEKAREKAKPN